jgi:hypothetical protein
VELRVNYGLGGSFEARFDRIKIHDWNLAKLLKDAVDRPRPPGESQRTAKVVGDLLREHREVDIELIAGASDRTAAGRPVTLGHVPVPSEDTTDRQAQGQVLTVQISESYKGGVGRGR